MTVPSLARSDIIAVELEVCNMLAAVTGSDQGRLTIHQWLCDGQVLCIFANMLCRYCAGIVRGRVWGTGDFRNGKFANARKRENINKFLTAYDKLGGLEQDQFVCEDLFKGNNMRKVILCLFSLGDIIQARYPDSDFVRQGKICGIRRAAQLREEQRDRVVGRITELGITVSANERKVSLTPTSPEGAQAWLTNRLAHAQQEIESLQSELRERHESSTLLQTNAEQEIESLKRDVVEVRESNAALESKVAALETQLQSSQAELEAKHKSVQALQGLLDDSNKPLKQKAETGCAGNCTVQ